MIFMPIIDLINTRESPIVSMTQQSRNETQDLPLGSNMSTPTTHQGLERILQISSLLGRLIRAVAGSLAINPKQR
jgi:predicted dienelactone hydrolase